METYPFVLSDVSTRAPDSYDKGDTKSTTIPELHEKLYVLQRMLYAQSKYSILVVFQGMDASGKNSMTKRVFHGVNPLGCAVKQFTPPTEQELAHDFLWRVHQRVPPKGMIHIFNRSHYEDILEPTINKTHPKEQIEKRYAHINQFEELLAEENNTKILKFYLHISREEQKERLEKRLHKPRSHWKHNDGDRSNRKKRDAYVDVYEEIFDRTHTDHAPWYVIPADQKWYACYEIVSRLVKLLEDDIDLAWPELETELFADELNTNE